MRYRFSETLHSADWCLVTEVSEKNICPILQGIDICPETSVTNYRSTLLYILEEIDRLS